MVKSCWTISERHKQNCLQYADEGCVHNVICCSIVNEGGIEIKGEGHRSTIPVKDKHTVKQYVRNVEFKVRGFCLLILKYGLSCIIPGE